MQAVLCECFLLFLCHFVHLYLSRKPQIQGLMQELTLQPRR